MTTRLDKGKSKKTLARRQEKRLSRIAARLDKRELALKLLRRMEVIQDCLRSGDRAEKVGELELELSQLREVTIQLGYSPKIYFPPEGGSSFFIRFVEGGAPGGGSRR